MAAVLAALILLAVILGIAAFSPPPDKGNEVIIEPQPTATPELVVLQTAVPTATPEPIPAPKPTEEPEETPRPTKKADIYCAEQRGVYFEDQGQNNLRGAWRR